MTASLQLRATFATALAALLCLLAPPAAAQSQFEQCNAVLQGDLMNKVVTSSSADTTFRHAMRQYVFTLSDDQAFEVYNTEFETAKKQGQKGSLGINYFGVGGNADFEVNYDNKISRAEFKQKFNAAKRIFQQSGEQTDSSSTSLASAYASYTRDAASIEAWKACVTQRAEQGLYAFASRDQSDEPFVNVVYGPGTFQSFFPNITIDKISLPEGASIADDTRVIGVGSGHTFRISFPDHKRGFKVVVNGNLIKDGVVHFSFSAQPQVPPVRGQELPPRTTPTQPVTPASDCTFGKNTCKQGFVWRVAGPTDLVCVTPAARDRAAQENADAPSHQHRTFIFKRPRTVCNTGFVRRNAFSGDTVCVSSFAQRLARRENLRGPSHIACLQP